MGHREADQSVGVTAVRLRISELRIQPIDFVLKARDRGLCSLDLLSQRCGLLALLRCLAPALLGA